eukprot:jgi/Psemu1/287298/fgenesh1_pg.183_\
MSSSIEGAQTSMNELLEETFDEGVMMDESSFIDESEIDEFLEYAREVIAENNLSYDSTSFSDFEKLLQKCVANHFLDSNHDNIDDSMKSECSFSGYLNDESQTVNQQKSALLLEKGIMSDRAYCRMKGIIARKKTISAGDGNRSNGSDEIGDVLIPSKIDCISTNPLRPKSEFNGTNSEDVLFDLKLSRMNSQPIFPRRYDSDSSDSVVDKKAARKIRRKKNLKRSGNKNRLQGESITQDCISERNPNLPDDDRLSVILKSPRSKAKALRFLSEHAPSLHDSVLARLDRAGDQNAPLDATIFHEDAPITKNIDAYFHTSEQQQSIQSKQETIRNSPTTNVGFDIDTANTILPSLVKKGIMYFDIPRIEGTLHRMLQKTNTMSKKQKLLNQLVDKFASERKERHTTQKGMASLHKLRARKKAALQATYLRYSVERQHQLKQRQSPKLSTPQMVKDEPSATRKFVQFETQPMATRIQHDDPLEVDESVSPTSCVSEKLRLKNLLDKKRRSQSHSMKSSDTESLLQSQMMEHDLKTDHGDETVSRTMPFKRIIFSRPKGDVNYEVLSPTSSLSNGVSSDLDNFSSSVEATVEATTKENDDGAHVDSSDDSAWSEMSFLSDANRFIVSSMATLQAKGNFVRDSQKYHLSRPHPIETNCPQTFNDSFDDIVLRNTPKLHSDSKSCSDIVGGGKSPTGVMDIFSEQQQLLAGIGDALAFVDDDEGDHVFTDKEDDSFLMKSTDHVELFSEYQPVFFSSSRFEI